MEWWEIMLAVLAGLVGLATAIGIILAIAKPHIEKLATKIVAERFEQKRAELEGQYRDRLDGIASNVEEISEYLNHLRSSAETNLIRREERLSGLTSTLHLLRVHAGVLRCETMPSMTVPGVGRRSGEWVLMRARKHTIAHPWSAESDESMANYQVWAQSYIAGFEAEGARTHLIHACVALCEAGLIQRVGGRHEYAITDDARDAVDAWGKSPQIGL